MLQIRTLGGLSASSDHRSPAGAATQPRRLAVLALIARAGERGITREKLLAMLWPDTHEEPGRRALTQALYALRKDLGADELFLGVQELRLNPELARCDAVEFEAALRAGEAERAASLYGGPFLDGFRLPGAAEFDRWADDERTALQHRYADALERLAVDAAERGEARAAAGWWRKLAALDALNATVAVRLMEALVAAGDRSGALQHARIYEALMEQELDLPPDAEVVELAERIRAEPPPAPARKPVAAPAAAPAAEPAEATATVRPGPAAPEPEPAAPAETVPPLPAELAAEPGAPPTEPAAGAARSLPPRRPRPRARLRTRQRLAAAALAVLVLAVAVATTAWVAAGRTGGLIAAGVMQPNERLLLADFDSPSGDSLLAEVATEALRVDLSQSRLFGLVDPTQVRGILQRMERPPGARLDAELAREVAIREGIRAVIVGEVGRVGGSYVFSARIVATESGDLLAAVRETARDSTAIIDAMDRLSGALRGRVGESLRQVRSTEPLAQVTTGSLEALRLYTRARRAITVEGDMPRAIALLTEAVAIDTAFASGHRVLATALGNVGSDPARRMDALARAYRHRDRLTERERLFVEAGYYQAMGEPDRAIAAYEALLERLPDDVGLLNNLGRLYTLRRDYARAEVLYRRAIVLDSLGNAIPYMNLQRSMLSQGRPDEAQAVIERMERLFAGAPMIPIARASLAGLRGDLALAEAQARGLRDANRDAAVWRIGADRMLGHVLAAGGRLREAQDALQDAAETSERGGDLAGFHTAVLELASLDVLVRNDARLGLERVDAALRRHPLDSLPQAGRPYLSMAMFFALANEPARAQRMLQDYAAATPAEQQRADRRAAELARGLIALAESRSAEAVRLLRAADTGGCSTCVLPALGLAYDQAVEPDSVLSVFERYLQLTWPDRVVPWRTGEWEPSGDAFWRARIHRRLAELYEARGDREAAARHHAALAELWRSADPELQPRRADAERRLAVLRAGR